MLYVFVNSSSVLIRQSYITMFPLFLVWWQLQHSPLINNPARPLFAPHVIHSFNCIIHFFSFLLYTTILSRNQDSVSNLTFILLCFMSQIPCLLHRLTMTFTHFLRPDSTTASCHFISRFIS